MKENTKLLSVVIPIEMYSQLKSLAFRDDLSVSEEVRHLLEQTLAYIDRKEQNK